LRLLLSVYLFKLNTMTTEEAVEEEEAGWFRDSRGRGDKGGVRLSGICYVETLEVKICSLNTRGTVFRLRWQRVL
jgi:hypothetical protein